MKTFLALGTRIDSLGDPFDCVYEHDMMIPSDHSFLINFLRADIEHALSLLRDYVNDADRTKLNEAVKIISSCHPYFSTDMSSTYYRINSEIASLVWNSPDVSNKELDERFSNLCVLTDTQEKDPAFWQSLIGYSEVPSSLSNLLEFQDELKRKIFLLFDESNPKINVIPFEIRSTIFSLVSHESLFDGSNMPFFPIPNSRYVLPYSSKINALDFDTDLSIGVHKEVNHLAFDQNASTESITVLASMLSGSAFSDAFLVYDIKCVEDLINLEVSEMLKSKIKLHRCHNCGRYFFRPSSVKSITDFSNKQDFLVASLRDNFCSYNSQNGGSCVSAEINKVIHEDVFSAYRKAYKTRFKRVSVGSLSHDEFNSWKKKSVLLRDKTLCGDLSFEDYLAAINTDTKSSF